MAQMAIYETNISIVNGVFQITPTEDFESSIFQSSTEPFLRFATQENLADNCPICRDDLVSKDEPSTQVSFLKCGHFMHTQCIDNYIYSNFVRNSTCPVCRTVLFKKAIDYFLEAISAESESGTIVALEQIRLQTDIGTLLNRTDEHLQQCISWLKSPNKELARSFLYIFKMMLDYTGENGLDRVYEPFSNEIQFILREVSAFDIFKILEYEVRNDLEISINVFYKVLDCFYSVDGNFILFGGDRFSEEKLNYHRKNLVYLTKKVSGLICGCFQNKKLRQHDWVDYIDHLEAINHLRRCDIKWHLQFCLFRKINQSLVRNVIPDEGDVYMLRSAFSGNPNSATYHILLFYNEHFFDLAFSLDLRPPTDSPLFGRWSHFVKIVLDIYKGLIEGQYVDNDFKFVYDFKFSHIECFTPMQETCIEFLDWWLEQLKKGRLLSFIFRNTIVEVTEKIWDIILGIEDESLSSAYAHLIDKANSILGSVYGSNRFC